MWIKFLNTRYYCQDFSLYCRIILFSLLQLMTPVCHINIWIQTTQELFSNSNYIRVLNHKKKSSWAFMLHSNCQNISELEKNIKVSEIQWRGFSEIRLSNLTRLPPVKPKGGGSSLLKNCTLEALDTFQQFRQFNSTLCHKQMQPMYNHT